MNSEDPHDRPPPLPLDYAAGPRSDVNAWWKVGLRFLAGAALAVGSVAGGAELVSVTGSISLFLVVPGVVFAGLFWVQRNLKRRGYVAGFLAPYIICLVVVIFLFLTCIGMAARH